MGTNFDIPALLYYLQYGYGLGVDPLELLIGNLKYLSWCLMLLINMADDA